MATRTRPNARRTRLVTTRPPAVAALLMGALTFFPASVQAGEPAPAEAPLAGPDALERTLTEMQTSAPMQRDGVHIVPLVQPVAPTVMPVTFGLEARTLRVTTLPGDKHDTHVAIQNEGERASFLASGTLLAAGTYEHVLTHSVLVPAGASLEVSAPRLSAEEGSDNPVVLGVIDAMAPAYLRQDLQQKLDRNRVDHFLKSVRPLADSSAPTDQTLSRLLGSKAVDARCPSCVANAIPQADPALRDGKVVGYVLVVDGRAQVLELYASNAMMQAHLPAALRSTGLAVAALELRGEELGLTKREGETPKRLAAEAKQAADEALASLKRFGPKAEVTETRELGSDALERLRIESRSTEGTALLLDGRMVHATLYPHDPYRNALFAEPLDTTQGAGSGTEAASRGELERRAARGTLPAAEDRRRERITPEVPDTPGVPDTPEVR